MKCVVCCGNYKPKVVKKFLSDDRFSSGIVTVKKKIIYWKRETVKTVKDKGISVKSQINSHHTWKMKRKYGHIYRKNLIFLFQTGKKWMKNRRFNVKKWRRARGGSRTRMADCGVRILQPTLTLVEETNLSL
jgi:hypothetical protein